MTGLLGDWDRYALIVDLAERLHGNSKLGKKALQKLVYLLQELENVPAGYRFRFFTYGPFADNLAFTLDVVESMGGVKVDYDRISNSYRIGPGAQSARVAEQGLPFIEKHRDAIDRLIARFGNRTAMELELIATIVYLVDEQGVKGNDALIEGVIALKPKYERWRIARALEELKTLGYIE